MWMLQDEKFWQAEPSDYRKVLPYCLPASATSHSPEVSGLSSLPPDDGQPSCLAQLQGPHPHRALWDSCAWGSGAVLRGAL